MKILKLDKINEDIATTVFSNQKKISRPLLEHGHGDCVDVTASGHISIAFNQNGMNSSIQRLSMLGSKADKLAHGIREHVRLGTKITETLKGKLSLGARILQVGGINKVYRHSFVVKDGERLLKAFQCYLSTTSGPIAGLLFISTDKIAFCSERSIGVSSPSGELARFYYKVRVPLKKIKAANQSENSKEPTRKYIEIVTVDDFDFWFMGFLNHHKAFKYLQHALSQIS